MKKIKTSQIIAFILTFATLFNFSAVQAGEDGLNRGLKKKFLERFDTDGDGVLSDAEKAEARLARQNSGMKGPKLKKEMLEQFDTDGDGILNDEEKASMRKSREERAAHMEAIRAKMLEEFDADGDGVLNETERANAFNARLAKNEKFKANVLSKFDADGNGELSDAELAKASKAFGKVRKRHGMRQKRGGKARRSIEGGDSNTTPASPASDATEG